MNEALRQRRLVAVLAGGPAESLGLRQSGDRAARGLEAYRANAEAIAGRALAACFPTVQAMLGADDFSRLACEFRRASPPDRGDLGEWGAALPAWLAAHAGLAPWPWLADCARLDLAVHAAERAFDATCDGESFGLLGSVDPAALRLVPMTGSTLIESTWPIGSIHHAHRLTGDAAEPAFEAVREAIAAQRGERVLVARRGWRAIVHALDEPTAAWTRDLIAGTDLASALARAGDGFDFAAWLGYALRESLLKGVVVAND